MRSVVVGNPVAHQLPEILDIVEDSRFGYRREELVGAVSGGFM